MTLRVETRAVGDRVLVVPHGDIDMENVARLREVLNGLFDQGGAHVVLDLDHTTFIDSAGLGALVGARRRAHTFRGSVVIVCRAPRIRRVFEVTRLDRVFDLRESYPDDLSAEGAGPADARP
jgi:anti-sigma B factor antagonist